jgi:membrane-bound lytic murein transglycosylase
VFFRVLEGLEPGVSGTPKAPVFAATRDPVDGTPIRRLLHAQDTGGAIRGPARGDLFWGWGEAAALRAGLMREAAEVFVLVPREEADDGAEDGAAALLPAAPPHP